jgi:hypothetical protein
VGSEAARRLDPREYMRHLIREDRKRAAQEQLEAFLLEGLDSGTAEPWSEADVEAIRAAVRERLKKRRGAHTGCILLSQAPFAAPRHP